MTAFIVCSLRSAPPPPCQCPRNEAIYHIITRRTPFLHLAFLPHHPRQPSRPRATPDKSHRSNYPTITPRPNPILEHHRLFLPSQLPYPAKTVLHTLITLLRASPAGDQARRAVRKNRGKEGKEKGRKEDQEPVIRMGGTTGPLSREFRRLKMAKGALPHPLDP